MSEPEIIGDIIPKSLSEVDATLRKKILQQELLSRWKDIFGAVSAELELVKLDNGVLVIASQNSAARDFVKYGANGFIEKINAHMKQGDDFVTKIEFGRGFNPPPEITDNLPAPEKNLPTVELAAEEIADCEKKAAAISDEDQRQIVLETLLSHAKSEKSKLARDWHKCKFCELLCPPEETVCDICKVRERERLHKKIRRIFYDAPWTPFSEVQEKILEEFPHLQAECTLDTIDAARMDLILQAAARVSFGDTTSDDAKFLVMLVRQLPREKLTTTIINRTLKEFHFNLVDRPPFDEYEFRKMPRRSSRKIKKSAAQTE